MAFLGLFNSNEGKRNRKKARQFGNQARQQRDKIGDLLQGIVDSSEQAYQDANKTVQERYGDQLQDMNDAANANVAAGNQAISRSMMASGGDVTGQGAVQMGKNQERGNESISKALNYFTQRNEQANRRSDRRGDQLVTNALGGREGLYQSDMSQNRFYEGLERKRKQANNQFLSDLLGAGASVGAAAI